MQMRRKVVDYMHANYTALNALMPFPRDEINSLLLPGTWDNDCGDWVPVLIAELYHVSLRSFRSICALVCHRSAYDVLVSCVTLFAPTRGVGLSC